MDTWVNVSQRRLNWAKKGKKARGIALAILERTDEATVSARMLADLNTGLTLQDIMDEEFGDFVPVASDQ